MEIEEVDAYSRARPRAEKDFKAEWEWWRYLVCLSFFSSLLFPMFISEKWCYTASILKRKGCI